MNDRVWSVNLKKDCNTNEMTWDDSCSNPSDGSKYKGNNFQNRINACKNANLAADARCKNWCSNNPTQCPDAIETYCNNLPIDTMINDNFCKTSHSNRIKGERCPTKSELFGTAACKIFCGS